MGASAITVRPYDGTLASLNLGGITNVNVLNGVGPPQGATINDADGILNSADDGIARFILDGSTTESTINYIGSGSVSLISALGIELFPRPISIFEVDGQIYFYVPEGLPPLSLVNVSFNIDPEADLILPDFVPCFLAGTRITTPSGNRAIENIQPGDTVLDTQGRNHTVLWTGAKTIHLDALCEAHYQKLVPVRISSEAMGGRAPFRDLIVSQQHRVAIRHPATELLYGHVDCFVPAVSLVGYMANFATDLTTVTYHHILCKEHITLLANGVEAESLFLGDLLSTSMRPALRQEMALVFPELRSSDLAPTGYQTSLPSLRAFEGRVLCNILAGPPKCKPTPKRPTDARPRALRRIKSSRYTETTKPPTR
ncbi:Hint domain-containing protein [Loktanella sp. TSTF-M6]|uniref:Hint domain-containing protein n=1 Tax=Loktanella gaetbuli TaxID=2881335 RepID=A0ABS8BTW4_9RHOB|nr:Hint domain-containing protein [Loktanella gaetbuli]MCB5199168.1 Hint domain-containing protein [Loktanella gaetbuli]